MSVNIRRSMATRRSENTYNTRITDARGRSLIAVKSKEKDAH
jgi:hypothetical protein